MLHWVCVSGALISVRLSCPSCSSLLYPSEGREIGGGECGRQRRAALLRPCVGGDVTPAIETSSSASSLPCSINEGGSERAEDMGDGLAVPHGPRLVCSALDGIEVHEEYSSGILRHELFVWWRSPRYVKTLCLFLSFSLSISSH